MKATRTLCSLALAALLSGSAAASADELPETFETMLAAIDVVPSRDQLDAAWPDAQSMLIEAALDDAREGYTRQRAITLLSAYPDATTRAALQTLTTHADAEVRRIAGYTLVRGWGAEADADLLATAARLTEDADADVRAYAVRALRWVDAAPAADLLVQLSSDLSDPDRADLARSVLARRAERDTAQGPTVTE